MKIALIIFLARYYNKIPYRKCHKLKIYYYTFFAIFVPVLLVAEQPDLGTSSTNFNWRTCVIWLTGFRIKFFLYSFFFLICLIPVGISFLKPYQKIKNLNFF